MSEKTNFFSKVLPKGKGTRTFFIVVVALGIVAAVLLSNLVSNVVARRNPFNVPGIDVVEKPTQNLQGSTLDISLPTPTLPPPDLIQMPPEWDGKTRINILIMGLDIRDQETDAPRTDSMILFTMDPLNNTAGMISIPRDLWVKIPNADYGKINTAYRIGEQRQLPGGGPENARKAVENLLGVPIQYYTQIDFKAFVKFIDDIDGVRLDIKEPIDLDILYTQDVVHVEPGIVTLPGELALAYVRNRSTAMADFDRANRQQEVILAVRDRIVTFKMFPMLVSRAPQLYADLSQGIHTNMDLPLLLSFAQKVLQIPRENYVNKVIDNEYVMLGKTADQDMLRPIPEKIRELRDEVFGGQSLNREADLAELLQQENARIFVRNASNTPGFEVKTAEYLKSQGLNVVQQGSTTYQTYSSVTIIGPTPHALKNLTKIFNITNPGQVKFNYTPGSEVDLYIDFGDDWVASNPMH
ncbi:MAG: LCP family protein [Anaerolineaceae bacterium]|nr:LCP family protein [Anaerolineaceae bacterium]